MKILYDFRIFEEQRFGGISRYFYELMQHFRNDPDLTWELPIRYTDNEYLLNLNRLKDIYEEDPISRGKWRLRHLRNRLFLGKNRNRANKELAIERIQSGEYDIFHPTYYDDYFLKFLPKNKPFVLTVYDMIHEIYPEYFSLTDPTSNHKKMLVQRAARIIAISETTKRDLVDIFGVDKDKVTVIYLGNSLATDAKPTDSNLIRDLPVRYLLFVGDRRGHKNFYFFLRAVSALLLANPELQIVCAGSSFKSRENQFFKSLGLIDRIKQYAVDDVRLAYLYQNAMALVFPSLYEGFGLPVLEAFNCGCPAVLSASGSLPEIGGEAAIYFNPKDGRAIREAVSRVINDEDFRRELIRKGAARAKDFSWEKTAQMTQQVYADVLACSSPKRNI